MSTTAASNLDHDRQLTSNRSGGSAEARVWWTTVPSLPGEKLGVIGGFSATGEAAAHDVLARACEVLQSHGCTLAVGPMDGNTWRRYRLVTDAGDEPPFFLEPTNPPEWPGWWRAFGFAPLAEYYSAATDDLTTRDARLEGVLARMKEAGVSIRPIDLTRFEAELSRIFELSLISFRENFLYTPLPHEAFVSQYRAIQSRVRPELVLLAEANQQLVGYVFATPDFAQAQRGEPVTNVIVKTLAVRPGRAFAGLGAWLLGEVHAAARQLGFRRAIHALMHETNRSRNLSAHYSRTIRRYTLYSRRLKDAEKNVGASSMRGEGTPPATA